MGPEIPQLFFFRRSFSPPAGQEDVTRFSWLHHMWTQLLVIVGYYGLTAPRLCLASRAEPSLVVTFKLLL